MIRRSLAAKNQPLVLILLMVLDLLVNVAAPKQKVKEHFDHLRLDPTLRPLVMPIKTASVLGLLAGMRRRELGVLTAAALVVYFVLALGYHRRARDNAVVTAPAVLYGGVSVRALLAFLTRA